MQGRSIYFLRQAINSVRQLRRGYEIIVSDESKDYQVEDYCQLASVKYFRNTRTSGAAGNLNNAIDHATGELIKVLFQDDQLKSIEEFDTIHHWGFCTSKHNTDRGDHIPYHPPSIKELALGCNTYGSPSALAFRKTDLRFNESLQWLFDCEFYARMSLMYGLPDIINTAVDITEWHGMATNTICTGSVRLQDTEIINRLYADI
jgi:glycosyltransferase involved in cell wall biosynthesis